MSRRLSNASRGAWKRGLCVLPALATAALMAGVVVPRADLGAPFVSEQDGLEEHSTAGEAERADAEDFAAHDGAQRLERIERAIDAALAPPRPAIELWTLVRLCFERSGLSSRSLDVRALEPSGLPELGDLVATRRVALEGTAPLGTLVRAVDELRALGEVVSVDEAHFRLQPGRGATAGVAYETRVVLCFWSRIATNEGAR